MSGQQEQRPRWKRALDEENDAMGMVLGRIFVKQYFPEASKQRYTAMVEAIRGTFHDRIERLDWMGADTKAKALAKLAAVTPKVGYPDKWKDYSALVVGRESYAANVMAAQRWQFQDNLAKFGKPVDRTEWDMTPQTYNAYYNPSNNEIVLPAAMFMVPGVPDAQVDDAVAYGYVAAGTIGHEITHGFDDQGRQYDAQGNLSGWWTAQDAERFNAAAQKMVDAVQCVRAAAGPAHQRQGEPGREHRRLRRPAARPGSLREDRAVQAGQDDRRTHADAALLPRLRAGLDEPAARGTRCASGCCRTCTPRRSGACSARCRTSPSSTRRSA